jgi:hypothetical protein
VVSLVIRKAAACLTIFLILLTGAWYADQSIQGLRESKIKRYLPEGVSILHTEEWLRKTIFSPREYVKIIRYKVDILDESSEGENENKKRPTSFIYYE